MAGTLVVSTLNTGRQSVAIEDLIQSGVRAWVNMDGQGNVRASSNISSVTQLSLSKFQVSFIHPMPHANYVCTGFGSWDSVSYAAGMVAGISSHKSTQLTDSVIFFCVNSTTGTPNTLVADVHFLVAA